MMAEAVDASTPCSVEVSAGDSVGGDTLGSGRHSDEASVEAVVSCEGSTVMVSYKNITIKYYDLKNATFTC